MDEQHATFRAALERMGLLRPGESLALEPLAGGVSSDIVRARWPRGTACIKRALPKLKVRADWRAPVERNHWEREWIRVAGAIVPAAVPALLGEDAAAGMFAMAWLDPDRHPVWKAQLRDGIVASDTAAAVGRNLAAIHAATARDPTMPRRFATDHIFQALRLKPYLLETARRHAGVASRLEHLAQATARTKRALVHGDVSPKNILVGPDGPVFIDAECAWFGDPAFDLAFCANHLLLKCLWRPGWRDRYLDSFAALCAAYLAAVSWEPPSDLERRAAHLLPGLFLARIDGKSPVEYITVDTDRERVRRVAIGLLCRPVDRMAQVGGAWRAELDPGCGQPPGASGGPTQRSGEP